MMGILKFWFESTQPTLPHPLPMKGGEQEAIPRWPHAEWGVVHRKNGTLHRH